MTERKWTAGPWVVTGNIHRYADGPDTGYDGEYINHADANLIAAAPELYDALDASLMYLECCCDHDGSDPASKVLVAARAALAKARGEVK